MIVEILIGAVAAIAFVAAARASGRFELALLGAGLVVAAVAYDGLGLLRAEGPLPHAPVWSTVGFTLLAVLGAVGSPWYLAAGWALHAGWDFLLPGLADVGYMPPWYAGVCVGFDIVAASYLTARALGQLPAPEPGDAPRAA